MSNWLYYRDIIIDHTKIDSTLTDYPVMVKLDNTNFDFSKVRADGYDLIFTNDIGETQLKHEIELFDGVNEKAVYHIKIPIVSDTVDTTFRMYYGDATITTDQSDKTNVWDSNFVMVQHMGESLVDSTGNGNDGTNYGTTVVDGLNGKARSFNGTSQYVKLPNITLGNNWNVSVIYSANSREEYTPLISALNQKDFALKLVTTTENAGAYFYTLKTGSLGYPITPVVSNGAFYTYTVTNNGTSVKLFQNGIKYVDTTTSLNIPSKELRLGQHNSTLEYANGVMCEVRISNIARSDAWIKADDYNLRTNTLLAIDIEVASKTITGMELIQEPTKTVYFLNESINLSGALIKLTYDDLSTEEIQPTNVVGFDSSIEVASQEVTITVGDFSESFYVTIRHNYTIGQIVTIKFTEPIISDVSGNENAFTVTGKEYKWVNGPDNNGPLIDKNYQVVSVVKHPILDDKYIRLILDDFSRFPSVEGDLTVEYNATIGNLAGISGAVESFEKTFIPIDLIPEPNVGLAETITIAPAELEVNFIPIGYVDRYTKDTLTVAPAELEINLIYVGVVNP